MALDDDVEDNETNGKNGEDERDEEDDEDDGEENEVDEEEEGDGEINHEDDEGGEDDGDEEMNGNASGGDQRGENGLENDIWNISDGDLDEVIVGADEKGDENDFDDTPARPSKRKKGVFQPWSIVLTLIIYFCYLTQQTSSCQVLKLRFQV